MKSFSRFILVLLVLTVVTFSCEPFEKVSDIPEIHYRSFNLFLIDTLDITIKTGELVFSFQDGDANFGLDTLFNKEDTVNLFLIPFRKIDGSYDSIDADIYGRKYAIYNDERLRRTGQNKTINGEIKVQIFYFLDPPYDTIRYDFYIVDRAGNKSNTETTPDIGF
jgi:hypothetical protein